MSSVYIRYTQQSNTYRGRTPNIPRDVPDDDASPPLLGHMLFFNPRPLDGSKRISKGMMVEKRYAGRK